VIRSSFEVPVESSQSAYRIGFEWGPAGALALTYHARPGDVAVVVDVLSFTTTVTVAVEAGIEVYPYPLAGADAPAYADARRAVLAGPRRAGPGSGSFSLSPASFEGVTGIDRVVLPSPNGSAISFSLARAGVTVVGACLRNAAAVGRRLADARRVRVVAAGERWPDGELRPAVEDLWGAGAVLAHLDLAEASPEARMAAAAYDAVRGDLGPQLATTASGRELVTAGFDRDVEIAAALDVSRVVPVLSGEAFADAEAPHGSDGSVAASR
jgi:2-phosphosulfolactate phosphatase